MSWLLLIKLSGAPAKIRTWNSRFEGGYDIHFTTGANRLKTY